MRKWIAASLLTLPLPGTAVEVVEGGSASALTDGAGAPQTISAPVTITVTGALFPPHIIKGGNHHAVKLEPGLLLCTEAGQYSFYRIPKPLLTGPR